MEFHVYLVSISNKIINDKEENRSPECFSFYLLRKTKQIYTRIYIVVYIIVLYYIISYNFIRK